MSADLREARNRLSTVYTVGQVAVNLEHEAQRLRQALLGEFDGGVMYNVFEVPDLHSLALHMPDECLFKLERLLDNGQVDFAISPEEGAWGELYRKSLAEDINGRYVFLGDAIKIDRMGSGLWVYDTERRLRAAIGPRDRVELLAEEDISLRMHRS